MNNKFKDQCKVFAGLIIMFAAGFYHCSTAFADINLVLPFYTKHIQYDQNVGYTEDFDNHAIGLEYSNENVAVGSTYVHKNSHDKHSLYNHLLGMHKLDSGIQVGGGVFVAIGGYDSPVIAAPMVMAKYKYFRATTSYPIMRLVNTVTSSPAFDLLNIQLVIPLR